MSVHPTPAVRGVFDPRKIRLAKEHFLHFHPQSLGRSLLHPLNLSPVLPAKSHPLSSAPSFNLKSWQVAPGVYEDTLYLCPWCLLQEKKNHHESIRKSSIWASQVFIESGVFWIREEDITRLDWEIRDTCGIQSLRSLAGKGPDATALERIREEDVSDYELDPGEEARIMEPLRRGPSIQFERRIDEEEEERFFDAVDDSPESGWESLEVSNSSQDDLLEAGEDDRWLEDDSENEDEDSFESSEIDPIVGSSLNIEEEAANNPEEPPVSESERFHREWLRCQEKIQDLKMKKYIEERLSAILSVAFAESNFDPPKSTAEAFESIPNANRDENGFFEIMDTNELQDLCFLSFVMRKEKFLP